MDELKKALYEKVFRFDEYSYTAVIDRSTLAADEIGLLITEVLQNRLNAEGTWEDDALNEIAEAVTMNFYVELESEIRKEPILYGQLDIGGIKKRLDAIEEWLKKQCDNENDIHHKSVIVLINGAVNDISQQQSINDAASAVKHLHDDKQQNIYFLSFRNGIEPFYSFIIFHFFIIFFIDLFIFILNFLNPVLTGMVCSHINE